MKKSLTLIILLFAITANSQNGYRYVDIGYGYDMNDVQQFSLSLEFSNANFNPWEIAIEGQRDLTTKEELFRVGAVYKPLILKKRNFLLNFRVGGLIGSNRRLMVLGPVAGFELSYVFPNLFTLFLQQNNHYVINIDDRFRHALLLGIKIPL